MDHIDVTTRTSAGAALTQSQFDTNLTVIRDAVNALMDLLGLVTADDGTLQPGVINTLNQITDGLITIGKLAASAGGDKGKFLRADKSTGVIAMAELFSDKETDSTAAHSTGTQSAFLVSTFTIEDVPAGDVMIWLKLAALKGGSGSNGGTLTLKQGSTVIDQVPTHVLDTGDDQWMAFSMFGKLADFAGGELVLTLEFETSEADSDVTFGVDGENRFGRSIMLVAGL